MPDHKKKKKTTRGEFRKAMKTAPGGETDSVALPQKRYYRQRAHANPFADYDLEQYVNIYSVVWGDVTNLIQPIDPRAYELGVELSCLC
jgi:hypothetical protein